MITIDELALRAQCRNESECQILRFSVLTGVFGCNVTLLGGTVDIEHADRWGRLVVRCTDIPAWGVI